MHSKPRPMLISTLQHMQLTQQAARSKPTMHAAAAVADDQTPRAAHPTPTPTPTPAPHLTAAPIPNPSLAALQQAGSTLWHCYAACCNAPGITNCCGRPRGSAIDCRRRRRRRAHHHRASKATTISIYWATRREGRREVHRGVLDRIVREPLSTRLRRLLRWPTRRARGRPV
jgi:hypothetical protein